MQWLFSHGTSIPANGLSVKIVVIVTTRTFGQLIMIVTAGAGGETCGNGVAFHVDITPRTVTMEQT